MHFLPVQCSVTLTHSLSLFFFLQTLFYHCFLGTINKAHTCIHGNYNYTADVPTSGTIRAVNITLASTLFFLTVIWTLWRSTSSCSYYWPHSRLSLWNHNFNLWQLICDSMLPWATTVHEPAPISVHLFFYEAESCGDAKKWIFHWFLADYFQHYQCLQPVVVWQLTRRRLKWFVYIDGSPGANAANAKCCKYNNIALIRLSWLFPVPVLSL